MIGAGLVTIAHIVAAVFCIIELGLTGYVASGWYRWTPSEVSFMIFNSIWSLLVLAYLGLTLTILPKFFHQLVSLGLLAVTTIFWFAGSIALAVLTGAPRCVHSICGSLQAACAFGFFIWAIFTGLLVLDILAVMRSRGSSSSTKPGSSGPYPGA